MSKRRRAANPFYVALVVVGAAFVVTACAYGVMAVRMVDTSRAFAAEPERDRFAEFFDEHGVTMLVAEVALLAALTFAAMATDEYWKK
jgi:hypothetical protein